MPEPAAARHRQAHPALRVMIIITPLLFSVLTWVLVGSVFLVRSRGGTSADLAGIIALTFVVFIFFLASFAIAILVNPHHRDQYGLIAAATATVFFSGFSAITVAVLAFVVAGLLYYRQAVLDEASSRIHFSFRRTVRAGLGTTLTLILLGVSIQSLAVATPGHGPDELLQNTINGTAGLVESLAPRFLPGFVSTKTIDSYLIEQTKADQDSLAAARQDLAKNLRISLTGQETLGQVIRQALEERVQPSLQRFAGLILPILVLSLFLLLEIFRPLLVLGVWAIGTIFFHLYRRFGLIRVVKETAQVERLRLS